MKSLLESLLSSSNIINEAEKVQHGGSYWDKQGIYQKEYEELFDELVPGHGKAKTQAGELLRAANKIYHDGFNNFFGNMYEATYDKNFDDYDDNPAWGDDDDNNDDGNDWGAPIGVGDGEPEYTGVEMTKRYEEEVELVTKYVKKVDRNVMDDMLYFALSTAYADQDPSETNGREAQKYFNKCRVELDKMMDIVLYLIITGKVKK